MSILNLQGGDPNSTRLRDLPFMDLYVRIDEGNKGLARFRSSGRDYSNNWSRVLPDKYRAESRLIADELLKNIENPDSSYEYDGMRFRQSCQFMRL